MALRAMFGGDGAVAFLHHPLIIGPGGDKLSKRDGAVSLRELLDGGATEEELAGRALGVGPLSVPEAVERVAASLRGPDLRP